MTPRNRTAMGIIISGLIVIGATILAVGQAMAQILPSVLNPQSSTCPTAVTMATDGSSCFDVIVKDIGGNPVWGSNVSIDFGYCSEELCPTQPVGITRTGNFVSALTDASGVAHFCICGCITSYCTADIFVDGVVQCNVPVEGPSCPGPVQNCGLVSNSDFAAGAGSGDMPAATLNDWSALTGSPQVTNSGCGLTRAVQMWGNQFVGESIKQALGTPIVAGAKYQVTVCYRMLDYNPALPPYVRFRLAVSGIDPADYPPVAAYDVIGVTPDATSTSSSTYVFPLWTAPHTAGWLTVNPENEYALDDPNFISWGVIDDICIDAITPTERKTWGQLKVLYR